MTANPQRTLYLHGGKPIRILRDGPALRVRQGQIADRLYPVRRLLKVVSTGRIDWSTDALLACADAGVPIEFLRRDGTTRASLIANRPKSSIIHFNELLADRLALPTGVEQYRLWFNAQGQKACLRLVQSPSHDCWPVNPTMVRRMLYAKDRFQARAGDLKRFNRQLFGLLTTHVAMQLDKAGISRTEASLVLNNIRISWDFSEVLWWGLQSRKSTYLRRRKHAAQRQGQGFARIGFQQAVEFFEQNAQVTTRAFDALLREFQLFLIQGASGHDNE